MYCDDCVEVLYLYDIREMWLDWNEDWNQELKDNFLVRQDIAKPLAAEPGLSPKVWRSIEDLIPDFHFRGIQLNLPAMKTVFADDIEDKKPYWLIAITEIVEAPGDQWLKDQVNPEWKFLGYDICAGPSF